MTKTAQAGEASAWEQLQKMAAQQARVHDSSVDAYLSSIRAKLHGLMPHKDAALALQEVAYWIERHAKVIENRGLSKEEALAEAIRLHGKPRDAALDIIEDYFESNSGGPILKRLGRANVIVFTIFGMATALYLLLLEVAVLNPSLTAIHSSSSPAAIHRYYPQQLPYPELSWQFLVTVGYPIVAPWFLGWWVGRLVPVRSAGIVLSSLSVILLISLVVAASLLPDKTGMMYCVFEAIYWLPVGAAMAHFSSSLLRRSRVQDSTKNAVGKSLRSG